MIITCPECLTKFQLAEEQIPAEGGARARCSRCRHVFPVERPQPPEKPPPETGEPGKYRRFLQENFFRGKRAILGLLLACILAALVFYFAEAGGKGLKSISTWRHSLYERAFRISKIFGISEQAEGFITLQKVGGYYLENNDQNRLFVIEGEAVNHWKEYRSFIKVKGALLDSRGNKVREQEVYCGNILSEKDLREMSGDAIEKSLSSMFGTSFSNVNIPPGGTVPFMIVFTDLLSEWTQNKPSPGPDGKPGESLVNLSDFTVEVTSSQKGSK